MSKEYKKSYVYYRIESVTAAPSVNTPLLSYAQSAYSRVSSEVQWSQSQAAQSASATEGGDPSDTNAAGGVGATNTGDAGATDTGGAGATDTGGAGATDTGGAGDATATADSTGGTGSENNQSAGSSTHLTLLSACVSVFLASFAAVLA